MPYFCSAAGDEMAIVGWVISFTKAALAAEKMTCTVYGSTTLVSWYGPSAPMADRDLVFGSTMWSNEALTAAALNGVPSWNLTPLRSLKV